MLHQRSIISLSPPKLALLVATRGMIAAGAAFLAANMMPPEVRRRVGMGLVAVGALSTLPLARSIMRSRERRWTF
jgi:hypothetical protein